KGIDRSRRDIANPPSMGSILPNADGEQKHHDANDDGVPRLWFSFHRKITESMWSYARVGANGSKSTPLMFMCSPDRASPGTKTLRLASMMVESTMVTVSPPMLPRPICVAIQTIAAGSVGTPKDMRSKTVCVLPCQS